MVRGNYYLAVAFAAKKWRKPLFLSYEGHPYLSQYTTVHSLKCVQCHWSSVRRVRTTKNMIAEPYWAAVVVTWFLFNKDIAYNNKAVTLYWRICEGVLKKASISPSRPVTDDTTEAYLKQVVTKWPGREIERFWKPVRKPSTTSTLNPLAWI